MQIRTGPLFRSQEEANRVAVAANATDPAANWKVIPSKRAPGKWTIVSERS